MLTTETAGVIHLIRCTVGATAAGFDLARVAGVERGEKIHPDPDAPGAVGRVTARGENWPVYPLAWWLGADAGDPGRGQVVLLDSPRGKIGLAVDRVSQAARVERGRVFPPPASAGTAGGLVSGVVLFDSGPLLVLDPDHLDPTNPLPACEVARPAPPARRAARPAKPANRLLALAWGELPGPTRRAVALGLPTPSAIEILPAVPPAAVPAAEDHVRGVVEWRGRPLTLLDPARWVGLTTAPRFARVVVAGFGGVRVGLVSGPEVRMLSAGTPVVPARHELTLKAERVRGVVDATDVTLVIPDWGRLVAGHGSTPG